MAKHPVEHLYEALLKAWNARDAAAMADLCGDEAIVIGFDGSTMVGADEVETKLTDIFNEHPTPAYVYKLKSLRFPNTETAILIGIAGMLPPGQSDLDPALNAIQSLVATNFADEWRISLFQNTPAALHGRPEARDAVTAELRAVLTGS